jgi:ribosomal protein S27AE
MSHCRAIRLAHLHGNYAQGPEIPEWVLLLLLLSREKTGMGIGIRGYLPEPAQVRHEIMNLIFCAGKSGREPQIRRNILPHIFALQMRVFILYLCKRLRIQWVSIENPVMGYRHARMITMNHIPGNDGVPVLSELAALFRHRSLDRAPGRQEFLRRSPERHVSESWEYRNSGQSFHLADGTPVCPACGDFPVIEQGYEHNHRHYCTRCGVIYWLC